MGDPTNSEELCAACGMCCDGTLFSEVPLHDSEAERVAAHRLRFVVRDGGRSFTQPCVARNATGCGAYTERPQMCRTFRCKLLIRVEEETLALNDAMQVVSEIRSNEPAIRALLSTRVSDVGDSIAAQFRRFEDMNLAGFNSPEFRQKNGELLMRYAHYHYRISASIYEREPEDNDENPNPMATSRP